MAGERTPLEPELLQRHSRQLMLPGYEIAAQERLGDARVLVVGAGGLGCAVLPQLVASGIGTIDVLDDDVVETSNLSRQTLYGPADVGAPKAAAAVARLAPLAPEARLRAVPARLDASNAAELVSGHDLVVDGSDNFATRYAVDDAAAALGIPLVWGAVHQYAGQCGVAWAPHHPTYRDLFPREPAPGEIPSCAEAGVLPGVCATVGALVATEVVKVLTGVGDPLVGRVLLYDARRADVREVRYRAGSGGARDTAPAPSMRVVPPVVPRPAHPADVVALTPVQLADLRAGAAPPLVLDVREDWEVALAGLPDARVVPLRELPGRIGEIPTDADVVVVCHHGVRSEQAARLLLAAGHPSVRHLAGGIDAWSRDVDPAVRRY